MTIHEAISSLLICACIWLILLAASLMIAIMLIGIAVMEIAEARGNRDLADRVSAFGSRITVVMTVIIIIALFIGLAGLF